ncbi:substrate-binding domain-containing protein [Salisediminibacterium selenitireducens]|uniref:DNA binding domain protein, excisionase family n=1 Tax=Bacillus selenitireducens (strain ATCC 700615 / DSM 15326 / MLS10) TaxID=439292 RepID=D6XZC7_BACIE|nr:helix-turn-helix transcriptional regulator [Salisediminibacterium selenitireducens]ADI00412.1 DNA binding domain protein, excisionase family [[Bacillus] selenitireducens MLS10]
MTGKVYTPDEVAALLQISKQTVYELIKRRELAAFKVGNKMRIEEKHLEAYKTRQSTFYEGEADGAQDPEPEPVLHHSDQKAIRLSGSHDLLLEKFVQHAYKDPADPLLIQAGYVGSIEGAMALYRGDADVAAMHVFDPDTNTYNLPFIRQLFASEAVTVVHLAKRRQGLIVTGGNPKAITVWKDLARQDVRFVNRQKGAGTRQLLDDHLNREGIRGQDVQGYGEEEWTHYAAAAHLLNGSADVTLGIEPVARMLGLGFIPLVEESFDLVFRWTDENRENLYRLHKRLQDERIKARLDDIPGYDLSAIGTVRYTSGQAPI